jgi:hypothetical protein
MGVDTRGIINKKIDIEEVYNFILNTYDKNAVLDKDASPADRLPLGSIYFKDGEDQRRLFCCNNEDITKFSPEYPELNFSDDVHSYLWVSLGYWKNSVEIIKNIINHFGGYVDENDCDDEGWYYLGENPNNTIPSIIKVTMKDIYEKFGGVVVITDKIG